MPSLLDDVNELIHKQVGDLSRIEHIKESIENNKPLYDSDKNYVNDLIKKYILSNDQKKNDGENTVSSHHTLCAKCSANLELNSNFCPKCGLSVISNTSAKKVNSESDKKEQSKKKVEVPLKIPREIVEREESIGNAIAVSVVGIIVILFGIGITVSSVSMPMLFAGQYMILGLFVIVIGGLIIYGGKRLVKKKESYFICGYCGFIEESERELYNHSLLCEKKRLEDSLIQEKNITKHSCSKCGFGLVNKSNFCTNCGSSINDNFEESSSTTYTSTSKSHTNHESNSLVWYLISTLFGIIGGFIGFFMTRKKNPKTARNCLIIGFLSSIIGIILISIM